MIKQKIFCYCLIITTCTLVSACGGGSSGSDNEGESQALSNNNDTTNDNNTNNNDDTGGGNNGGNSLFSVKVTWDIPTQREDGTGLDLSELDFYRIEYSYNGGAAQTTVIDVPTQSEEIITDLPGGTYVFSISAIDTQGVSSQESSPIMVIL